MNNYKVSIEFFVNELLDIPKTCNGESFSFYGNLGDIGNVTINGNKFCMKIIKEDFCNDELVYNSSEMDSQSLELKQENLNVEKSITMEKINIIKTLVIWRTQKTLKLKMTALKLKMTALKLKMTALKLKMTALKLKMTALKLKMTALKLKMTALKLKMTALKLKYAK
ncbi:hypothetical protein TNCT_116921 [Trichonephila clavata]|uniref:Uncharacterized protein n=1 Tax=Trichonephila clavata TaxID=2740835 RepID=A0A8X6M0H3_TRICU|nr:hypothetical protein TNCT_116921 [Trichonephila clavata]